MTNKCSAAVYLSDDPGTELDERMENLNMSGKHRYGAGMLAAALIVGIGIGFCGGFVTGNRMGGKTTAETAAESQQVGSETDLAIGESGETNQQTSSGDTSSEETEVEPIGSYAVDDEPVLTIDQTTVYLSEINARAYMARDQYVAEYGEEPWNNKMDNGMTVGEYAKAAMLDEIEREVILCNLADDYDVPALTEDEEKQCASKADDYMASLGEDVAAQFSVERDAVLAIYEKDALSMNVYNQILKNISADLRQEDEYKDMADSDLEKVVNDKFEEQYAQWKNDCKIDTTETWEQLVIGAVG